MCVCLVGARVDTGVEHCCVLCCVRVVAARVDVLCVGYVSAGGCRKKEGGWNSVPTPLLKSVVAVSYSPTPSQVQYHRRLRA